MSSLAVFYRVSFNAEIGGLALRQVHYLLLLLLFLFSTILNFLLFYRTAARCLVNLLRLIYHLVIDEFGIVILDY